VLASAVLSHLTSRTPSRSPNLLSFGAEPLLSWSFHLPGPPTDEPRKKASPFFPSPCVLTSLTLFRASSVKP
jgi:hypothetical protein